MMMAVISFPSSQAHVEYAVFHHFSSCVSPSSPSCDTRSQGHSSSVRGEIVISQIKSSGQGHKEKRALRTPLGDLKELLRMNVLHPAG